MKLALVPIRQAVMDGEQRLEAHPVEDGLS